MIRLYVAPSSDSSRKSRKWLKKHKIPFKERDISAKPLDSSDIKKLLSISPYGVDSIISKRSKAYKELKKKLHSKKLDLEDLPLLKLVNIMVNHPDLIKRPIIFSDKAIEVGYSEEEIRKFLPKQVKLKELHHIERRINEMN